MKKLLTISVLLLGCGGSEFTTVDSYGSFDTDASDASDDNVSDSSSQVDSTDKDSSTIDSYVDSAKDSPTDSTTLDSPVDSAKDSPTVDPPVDSHTEDSPIDSPTEALECLPGGEIIGDTCHYPEPQCCYYMDCPPPTGDYSCFGGECVYHTLPKSCKDDSCQQWCVNCYVPGEKNYQGTCNGDSCECNEI